MDDLFNIKATNSRKKVKFNTKPNLPSGITWRKDNKFPDLSGARAISIDVETKDPDIDDFGAGWGRGIGQVIGFAIGTDDGWQHYYPVRHEDEAHDNYEVDHVKAYLNDQLRHEHQMKVGHNLLYDLGWLAQEGVEYRGKLWDSRVAEKLLDFYAPADLDETARRYGLGGKDSRELYEWCWQAFSQTKKATSDYAMRRNAMKNLYRCPPALVGAYAESDVRLPIELARKQKRLLNRAGLWDVFDMECRLIPVLVAMRMKGVSVDIDAAEQAHKAIAEEIGVIQDEIDTIAGRKGVSTRSTKEMEIVFKNLGISPTRTPTGQVSLAGDTLRAMSHPIAQKIIDIEELKKYNSTFIESYILDSNVAGKIYGSFDPFGAKTGRFSSKQPNLQNIPSRNNLAASVRRIFIPDEGHAAWRKYDYASIENRVFAEFAVGQAGADLRQQYIDDPFTDYHNWCLDLVAPIAGWDVSTDAKYAKKRKPIKNINFGIVYGMGIDKLAADLGLDRGAAEKLMRSYHDALPHVKDTMDYLADQADTRGYSETILGRKVAFDAWEPDEWSSRPLPPLPKTQALAAYGFNIRRAGLYKATNYTIQGSAADLMKMAMVKCYEDGIFAETGIPRMTVHDELDFSDEGGHDSAFREMAHVMETAIPFSVPVIVDGEIGKNWADLKDIPRVN